jgi:GNAT superfamily N-acetyltransferase
VTEIREIAEGQTELAMPALMELRQHRWSSGSAAAQFVDLQLRPRGYRVVGVFADDTDTAVAVLGFQEAWSTARGHHLYVDDLVTLPAARRHCHGDRLLRWAIEEARRLDCEAVHLDSGVGADRAAAHRLYMRHHLRITSFHFAVATTDP